MVVRVILGVVGGFVSILGVGLWLGLEYMLGWKKTCVEGRGPIGGRGYGNFGGVGWGSVGVEYLSLVVLVGGEGDAGYLERGLQGMGEVRLDCK